jgi:hypothetical protein
MNELLVTMLVAVVAVNWRWPARLFIGCAPIIILAVQQHYWSATDDGLLYYGSAAAFDTMTVTALLPFHSRHAERVIWLSVASLVCNAAGWLQYELGQPADVFEFAMTLVLYARFACSLWVDGDGLRGMDAHDSWHLLLRGPIGAGPDQTHRQEAAQ